MSSRSRPTRWLASLACATVTVTAAGAVVASAHSSPVPPAGPAPYSDVIVATSQKGVNVSCASHVITVASLAGPNQEHYLEDCRAIKGDTLPPYRDYITALTAYPHYGKTCAEHSIYHSGYFVEKVEDCRPSATFAECKPTKVEHGNVLVNAYDCRGPIIDDFPPPHPDPDPDPKPDPKPDPAPEPPVDIVSVPGPLFSLVSVRQNKRGNAAITMRCPAYAELGCIGQVAVDAKLPTTRKYNGRSRQRRITLGKVVFLAGRDRLATVVIKLSPKARRVLRTKKSLPLTVGMTGWDPRGPSARTSANATLKRAKH